MPTQQKRRFAEGELVFHEGDFGDCAYIIESGRVEIFVESNHERVTLSYLGVGEIFGEMSVIDGSPRSASAVAAEPCEISVVSSEAISERIQASDPIVRLLISMLLKRMRHTNEGAKQLKEAKSSQQKGIAFEPITQPDTTHDEILEKMRIETELKEALDKNEFRLFYQPIVDIVDRSIAGFEGLIRWKSETRGLVRPDIFMGIAEETSLIVPIGKWVIETGTKALAQIMQTLVSQNLDHKKPFVSLNISGRQFLDPDFFNHLERSVKAAKVNPGQIKIEVTERVFMEGPNARSCIAKLREMGFPVALDDFGTGYSSLGYLAQFHVDSLKVDQSFVRSLIKDPRSMVITKAIVSMASGLDIPVIAEGIETEDEFAVLKEMDCHYGQGYLFAKPMPFEDALELLLNDNTLLSAG